MKSIICFVFILLLTTQLNAETYSWVDGNGTYNFSEDYSSVPKQYRKNVKRREDVLQEMQPNETPVPESDSKRGEHAEKKSAAVPDGKDELYGGKSRNAWRKELDEREAELHSIDQRLEQLRTQLYDPRGISNAQFEALKKEYDDSRATYGQKYKSYSDVIENIRNAGIPVEIKK